MKTPISAYLLAKNNFNYDGEGAWHWREPLTPTTASSVTLSM